MPIANYDVFIEVTRLFQPERPEIFSSHEAAETWFNHFMRVRVVDVWRSSEDEFLSFYRKIRLAYSMLIPVAAPPTAQRISQNATVLKATASMSGLNFCLDLGFDGEQRLSRKSSIRALLFGMTPSTTTAVLLTQPRR